MLQSIHLLISQDFIPETIILFLNQFTEDFSHVKHFRV